MKGKRLSAYLISSPYIVWAAIFIIVPLIIMLYYALTDDAGVFSLANFSELGRYKNAFFISILYAFTATIITLVLAYPLAYIMSKAKISSQRFLMVLVMLPMWTNFLIRTYSWITILSNTGIINSFLKKLGILDTLGVDHLQLINRPATVILGMVYDFLPYMILPIYTVMCKIEKSLTQAAEDLGADKINVLKRVILPLSLPGVASGITMVFVPSVSTFYISQKLGGNKTMMIGDVIEYLFNLGPDYYRIASVISLILTLMIVICMFIMNRFSDGNDDGGVIL